jgi:hypothetical protein
LYSFLISLSLTLSLSPPPPQSSRATSRYTGVVAFFAFCVNPQRVELHNNILQLNKSLSDIFSPHNSTAGSLSSITIDYYRSLPITLAPRATPRPLSILLYLRANQSLT